MNPWLWDIGQAHRDEVSAEAQCRRRGLPVEPPGREMLPPVAKRWRVGRYRSNFHRRNSTGLAPIWARTSAWTGQRMIAWGCRLVRPALVADAESQL